MLGYRQKTGQLHVFEFKSSATAPLTKNQKKGFPELEKEGAYVIGKGKGVYQNGYEIPPTKVDIVRPK
jgi:hypothetical protein